MTIDHRPLPEATDAGGSIAAERLRQLTMSTVTAGILHGLAMLPNDASQEFSLAQDGTPVLIGPDSYWLTVEAGTALDHNGEFIELTAAVTVDLSPLADGLDDGKAFLSLRPSPGAQQEQGAAVQLHVPGDPLPRNGVPIATIRQHETQGRLALSPIDAWASNRGVTVGNGSDRYLTITGEALVAAGPLRLIGRARKKASSGGDRGVLDHQLIIGPRRASNLILGGDCLFAESAGQPADLHLQRSGGETRFGGSIRGGELEPLTVSGGSDLSLGGGGVLMLGDLDGANLVLDENEIMAREAGTSAPLLFQWEGGETRFGGPLRGPAGGPLNIVGGQDMSLGGHGALMIGPGDAGHLILDENEIMARAGEERANLYLQWEGGETHFGGEVCGPDNGPLTLQTDGGTTQLGGPLEFGKTALGEPRPNSWRLAIENAADCEQRTDLVVSHRGVPGVWIESASGTRIVQAAVQATNDGAGEEQASEDLTDAVALVKRLRPRRHGGESPGQTTLGFLGDEVQAVAPELIHECGEQIGLCSSELATLALAAIKEQQRTIERLEALVSTLAAKAV